MENKQFIKLTLIIFGSIVGVTALLVILLYLVTG